MRFFRASRRWRRSCSNIRFAPLPPSIAMAAAGAADDVCFVCRNCAAESVCTTCNLVAHTNCLAKSMLHRGLCYCCPVCNEKLAPEAVLAAVKKALVEARRRCGKQHEATMRLKIRLAACLSSEHRFVDAKSILARLLREDRSAMDLTTLQLCQIELADAQMELGEVEMATGSMEKLVRQMKASEEPCAQPRSRSGVRVRHMRARSVRGATEETVSTAGPTTQSEW